MAFKIFHLFLFIHWICLVKAVSSSEIQNVASGKDASSSTAMSGYESSKAVDGRVNSGSYFRSDDADNQWWSVDLKEQYFLRRVKVFANYNIRGRLHHVSLFRSTMESPGNPYPLNLVNWNLVKYRELIIHADSKPPNNYMEYDSAAHVVPLARHVSLYTSNDDGLVIDEVEVYAVGVADFKPTNLLFDTSKAGCVTLSWDPPTGYADVRINYKVKLDNAGTWTSPMEDRTTGRCSLAPHYQLKYEVIVDGASSSAALSGIFRLPCAAPSKPTELSLGSAQMNCKTAGTPRWNYTVTWKEPDNVNCDSITGYVTKFPAAGSIEMAISTTSKVVYTTVSAGYITFSVSAKNKAGPSAVTTETVRTPTIVLALTLCQPTFSSSVIGGGYESWRAVDGNISGVSYFRSRDGSGPHWWRVDLGEKYFIKEIKVYNVFAIDGKLRDVGVYTSTLESPAIPPTAWTLVYSLKGLINTPPPNNFLQYNPVSSEDVIPLARQLALYRSSMEYGLAIDDVQVEIYTDAEFKPTNPLLTVSRSNAECVALSWDPPHTGVKTNYEVRCGDSDWSSVDQAVQTEDICNFPPNQQLKCRVKVKESTVVVSDDIKTPCKSPTKPREVKFLSGPSMNCEVAGIPRWQYTVSWQEPETVNCDRISNYTTKFPATATITTTSTVVYTELSSKEVTFTVSARNNANKVSEAALVKTTTPAIDAKSLTLCKRTSSSSSYNSSYPSWKAVDGIVTASSYFRSRTAEDEWWRVDLGERYFIREIKIYNVHKLSGRLQKVTIYASDKDTPNNLSSADWRWLMYQNNKTTAVPLDNYIEYDPVATVAIIPLARHVAVYTTHKDGLAIDDVQVFTFAPEDIRPTNLSLTINNITELSSCVSMHWTPLESDIVIRVKYEVKFADFEWTSVGEKRQDKRCGLAPNERWICKVRVLGAAEVDSISDVIGRECAAPLEPNVTAIDYVENGHNGSQRVKILIAWQDTRPNCESITHYNVKISTENILQLNATYGPDERNVSITDLDPTTKYIVLVRAVNNKNLGRDTQIIWLTRELKPSDPPGVKLTSNASCVNVAVSNPPSPNGVITHYDLVCQSSESEQMWNGTNAMKIEQGSGVFCGFNSASKVTCNVTASNSAGTSPPNSSIRYTQLQVVQMPDQNHFTLTPSKEVTQVLLKPVQLMNAKVRKYWLVVNKELAKKRKKRSLLIEGSTCHSDQLYNSSLAAKLGLSCYITAEIDESRIKDNGLNFNLGDNSNVGGYHNAPLKPGTYYTLIVVYIAEAKDGKMLTHNLDPYRFKTWSMPDPACSQNCAIAASLGVVVSLLAIGLVAGLLYYRRRMASKNADGSQNLSMDDISPKGETSPLYANVSDQQGAHGAHSSDVGEPSDYEEVSLSTTILVASLSGYISTNEDAILIEYKNVVEKQAAPQMTAAKLPENKGKCRFVGLYPEDEHRVKLDRGNEEGTDFINASIIAGYKADNEFIAAQGPTKNTVNDFWLMIWQQRPKAIVMVTGVVENGKPKCEQYWPEDSGSTMDFNGINVTVTSSEQWADYTIRTLRAKKDDKSISVKQFHYTSWPDHGVPAEMSPFATFVRKVNEETSRLYGRLLVHCSAGVGRTGTFIALDNLLAEAKDTGSVGVMASVRNMRLRRPKMVQAKEQYLFLHQILNEILATEGFLCLPNLLEDRLTIYRSRRGSANDLITKEFHRIEETLRTLVPDFSIALKEENREKNRVPDILADEKHSVWIGSGYINAVLLDDFKKTRHVIATQLPLENTIIDFWRMIEEQSVKVIVQLEYEDVKFYPDEDNKIIKFDEFVICWNEMEVKELVSIISLTATSTEAVSSVKLILINSWTLDEERFPDSTSLTNYLGVLEKCQQQTGDGKICVVDMDGSTRCGIFISAYNALEKLKSEQEVDMYSSVIMARYRRKEFVADIESYVYLYNVLKDFTDAFSEYANFQ